MLMVHRNNGKAAVAVLKLLVALVDMIVHKMAHLVKVVMELLMLVAAAVLDGTAAAVVTEVPVAEVLVTSAILDYSTP